MAASNLLFDLYCQRVEELSIEKNLTQEEKERIILTLKHAMANSFMDENQIYIKLTAQDSAK